MSDLPVVHLIGADITIHDTAGEVHRRQRCMWCGALLADDILSRMAWPLRPCPCRDHMPDGGPAPSCPRCTGTGEYDPGPPGAWPLGAAVAVTGELGSFRVTAVIPESDWPLADDGEHRRLPDGCCARLDPDVTR